MALLLPNIYARISARLATLQTFPKTSPPPTNAAHAGFYYTGTDDELKCFHCGGILDDWQKEDDVYLEHLIHFPNCSYIRHQMGAAAVSKVCKVQAMTNIPTEVQRGFIYGKVLGKKICILCYRAEASSALYPCGHALWCDTCSDKLSLCPKCSRQVVAKLQVIINN